MKTSNGGIRMKKPMSKTKKIIYDILFVIALAVFLFSAYKLISIYYLNYQEGKEKDAVQEVAKVPKNPEKEDFTIDWKALKEKNPEVVGWILIPDTDISYPIVQGSDNSEYLSKTFKGYDNTVGTIFVNAYNHADFNDRNTIIYGHYMYNGTMFNELEQYHEKSFWEKYPSFYIYTPDGNVATYQIYSVGVVKDTSEGYTYQFADDAAFASFLEATKASSLYDTGVEVGNDSQIVTLSTCTREGNDDRTIVHGVRVNVQPAGE